jgi:hypothetical protein
MYSALLASFDVAHESLPWPWIAIDPTHTRMAFVKPTEELGTFHLEAGVLAAGPTFALPRDLRLPERATSHGLPVPQGIRGFAVSPRGGHAAVVAMTSGGCVVTTLGPRDEVRRSSLAELGLAGFEGQAITFDRRGDRLWVSAESDTETALVLLEAERHDVLGVLRSAAFPRPSLHELHVHPQDDAVILLASCGEDGTFARVAGWSVDPAPVAILTALDGGGVPAGMVGFSADGARVHLVEDAALRTHAWPALEELSSVDLPDTFASSFSGAVFGDRLFVDGQDADTGDDDLVLQFDRSALIGRLIDGPAPEGMWVGRLGDDLLVTVSASGEPAVGRAYRLRT